MPKQKIKLLHILKIAQEIVNKKGLKIIIDVNTNLYSQGILSSIDILDLFLRLERLGIKVSHLKTNKLDSLKEIYEAINICK